MDGARVIAGLAIATAACGRAAAEDGSQRPAAPPVSVFATIRVKPPASWQALPAVGAAAGAAAVKAASTATTAIEAWGDPAAGCYAIAIDSRGTRREGVAASAARLEAALAPLGAGKLPAVAQDRLDVEVPIKGAGLTGTARVRLFRAPNHPPQGIALVCAGNDREPARCKTQCEALQLQLAPPVSP